MQRSERSPFEWKEQGRVRIAQFVDCFAPRINGVTTSVQLLAQALREAGHEVVVFTPSYPEGQRQDPGVARFRAVRAPFQPEDRCSFPWPARWWTERFDVVHVHTPFNVGLMGWWKSRWQRCPLIFTHHTLWEEYAHYLHPIPLSLGRWIGRGLGDFYFKRAHATVTPSLEIDQALRQSGRLRGRSQVIPTGIDSHDFRTGQAELAWQELKMPQGQRYFLFVGRMGKEKSIDFLLHCYTDYRRQGGTTPFVLLGGGPELEPLKQLAGQLGVGEHVHFMGYRARDRVKHFLAAAELFLFASETETQGLVLLEAAAAGVPTVAVSASGVNEAVDDGGSGVLLSPGDRPGFVEQILAFEREPERRAAFGARAQTWSEQFSASGMAEKLVELYRSVLA